MKMYERFESGRRFMPGLPIYARLDGKCFSQFTKNMKRPHDPLMTKAMIETTKWLLKETNPLIGYTQSDEINLVWLTEDTRKQIFFDGKIQKMVSVLAAMATVQFYQLAKEYWPEKTSSPVFDCRVFQLPNKMEASNAFLWRELDATKNAISMAARTVYSHNELYRKTGDVMQEMLWQKGINFNDYPASFKRGSFIKRILTTHELTKEELDQIPEKHWPEDNIIKRHAFITVDMPPFTKVTNRVGVVFDGEEPQYDG